MNYSIEYGETTCKLDKFDYFRTKPEGVLLMFTGKLDNNTNFICAIAEGPNIFDTVLVPFGSIIYF